jgi:hypothetical protein
MNLTKSLPKKQFVHIPVELVSRHSFPNSMRNLNLLKSYRIQGLGGADSIVGSNESFSFIVVFISFQLVDESI